MRIRAATAFQFQIHVRTILSENVCVALVTNDKKHNDPYVGFQIPVDLPLFLRVYRPL